ncbi:MAG: hypothetical protein E7568_01435 [Ruminococcaceae bacterium]|nr:hypothetical protein [Oscillospiraceae bacterium]
MSKKNIIIMISASVLLVAVIVTVLLLWLLPDSGSNKKSKSPSRPVTASSSVTAAVKERPEKIKEVFSFSGNLTSPAFRYETFHDSQNGNVIPYRLYVPVNYDSSKKYPIVLFLHGAGEIGSDNEKHVGNAKKMFMNNADLMCEAIVVCPQTYEWWNLDREYPGDQKGTLGSVLHLLTEIQKTYSCDRNRIYVTGLSMGGYATWNLLSEYGHIFAAGMPVCGGGDSSKGYELKDIPIRIYHSKDDPTVSFSGSERMYNAIIAAGGKKVKFIRLDGLGHNSWDYAYSDREGFCWMFAQNRTQNPTGTYESVPYFRVVDSNGKTVISEKNVQFVFSRVIFGENNATTVDLVLSKTGENKLKTAYESNSSKEFTVYWHTEKLYTFTVSGPPIDNTFSIAGIFDAESAKAFCTSIEKQIAQN